MRLNRLGAAGSNRWFAVRTAVLVWLLLFVGEECEGFGNFQLPSFPKWGAFSNENTGATGAAERALQPGDTVAVIGASGNVGKLVALRLSDTYKVNGVVRDASSVEAFFEGKEDRISLFEADLIAELSSSSSSTTMNDECPESLREALKDANAVVICTGTTAFPTKAWTKSGEEQVAGDVLKALIDTQFSVADAISSLDRQGLNTPNNVDNRANQLIVNAWNAATASRRNNNKQNQQKRIIMLSSIGVTRRDTMPFPILNACGVLSAKAQGEAAIQQAASDGGYSYTIIRPGQLFGGPYDNNYYLGTLFQLDKDADTQDVTCGQGDELLGDTLRSTLAEVTAQICEGNYANNIDFAVINTKGDTPSLDTLQQRLQSL